MWCALLLSIAAQEQVTFRSLLEELADPASLARWPSPEYRLRTSAGGIARDPEPTEPARGRESTFEECVLLDVEGPGALVALTLPASRKHRLRFYVDGGDSPTVETSPFDWSRGRPFLDDLGDLSRSSEGRTTTRIPVPFARRLRVVATRSGDAAEYAVSWREYDESVRVESFTATTLEDGASRVRASGDAVWAKRARGDLTFAYTLAEPNPDGFLEALDPARARGPRAIAHMEFLVEAPAIDAAVDALWLEMTFDGKSTVAVPFGAFFASRPGARDTGTRFARANDGRTAAGGASRGPDSISTRDRTQPRSSAPAHPSASFESLWLMPYLESFDLRIVNHGSRETHVSGAIHTIPWEWDERSLTFHASWRRTDPRERERRTVELRGRGVFVGDVRFSCAAADEVPRIVAEHSWIDDTSTSALRLASRPEDEAASAGHNAGSSFTLGEVARVFARLGGLEASPFTGRFDRIVEPSLPMELDVLSFWYGDAASFAIGATTDAAVRVRPYDFGSYSRPNVIEAETAHVVDASTAVVHRSSSIRANATGRWSGDAELRAVVRAPTGSIALTIPVEKDGVREVIVYPSMGPDHGVVRFYVNGAAVERTFDGFASERTAPEPFSLGSHDLWDSMRLTLELVPPVDPTASVSSVIGLDAVELR